MDFAVWSECAWPLMAQKEVEGWMIYPLISSIPEATSPFPGASVLIGDGLDDLEGFLPMQTVLWFYKCTPRINSLHEQTGLPHCYGVESSCVKKGSLDQLYFFMMFILYFFVQPSHVRHCQSTWGSYTKRCASPVLFIPVKYQRGMWNSICL